MQSRLTLNSRSFCLSLLSAGVTEVHHHAQLRMILNNKSNLMALVIALFRNDNLTFYDCFKFEIQFFPRIVKLLTGNYRKQKTVKFIYSLMIFC
jgi:hypothetical protein